jgi:hypothetical protein
MFIYLIIINIVLLCIVGISTYKWYTQRTYNRMLLIRSLELEFTLIKIYDNCNDAVQQEIQRVIDRIKPL